MKRRLKVRINFMIILSMAAIYLTACGSAESIQNADIENSGNVPGMVKVEAQTQEQTTEPDTQETDVQNMAAPEKTAEYDVEAELRQAEEAAAVREKKLLEDPSLSQADMNDLSYEMYTIWDDTLNDLWQVLQESLDEETMNGLLEEQRDWIETKEEEVQRAADEVGGGSLAGTVCNQRAARLTRARVYELAAYLGYTETAQKEDSASEKDSQTVNDKAQDNASEQWYRAYRTILSDWTTIEQYGDFEYLKFFFDSEYRFDNYWLCDVNSDGTPELFLHSDYMGITAIFTYYENEIRFLMYDVIYGINKETGEIVIEGHWHGAGGSGVDEWTVYHITNSEAVYSYYIDFFRDYEEMELENPYTIYEATTGEYIEQQDSDQYDEIYTIHVKPCIMGSNYQRYDLSDLTGLDVVQ